MNAQISLPSIKFFSIAQVVKAAKLLVALFILWLFREQISDILTIISDREQVTAYVRSFGALGPIILFGLLFVQVFIAVIPGHAVMMTGGYVYGFAIGVTITIFSTILASQLAFLVARKYGRSLIDRLASPQIIERWNKLSANQGIIFYFFAFVLPIFPSDLMCYVAGLGKISPARFFLANVLGRSLCAVSITLIGSFGFQPPLWFWAVMIASLIVFFAGWAVYKKATFDSLES